MLDPEIPQNFTLILFFENRLTVLYKQKRRMFSHSPYGWVSYLHRAATTYYLCCGQALEDLQGAGRIGLPISFLRVQR